MITVNYQVNVGLYCIMASLLKLYVISLWSKLVTGEVFTS